VVVRLRGELRRVAKDGGPGAGDAEIALGDGPLGTRLKSSILALAEHRGPRSSICPSDAARAVGGKRWRDLMADAREAARELARSGDVQVIQRGSVVDADDDWHGPVRIRITTR
jgi:Protein of unknown function (DUF3253)